MTYGGVNLTTVPFDVQIFSYIQYSRFPVTNYCLVEGHSFFTFCISDADVWAISVFLCASYS